MAGDTALFFSLSWEDASVVSRLASAALAEHRRSKPDDAWEIEWLLDTLARTEGERGLTVAGTVAKAPDVGWIIDSVRDLLTQIFSVMPDARAQIWVEGYEGSDDGSVISDISLADEETDGAAQRGLDVREHLTGAGLQHHEDDLPGDKEPDWAPVATRMALFFEWDDDRRLVPIAQKHLDKLTRATTGSDAASATAARYFRDKIGTAVDGPNVGPKGGMSVWGSRCAPVNVVELVAVLRPFLKEVCDDTGGAIMVYQDERGAARCCRVGWTTSDDDKRRFEIRHHALPFGLVWSPAGARR